MKQTIIFIVGLCFLIGCTVGPKIKESDKPKLPDSLGHVSIGQSQGSSLQWKELYADTTLQTLIKIALAENLDLRKAVARVDEARALSGMTKADFLPTIGYSGVGGKISPSQKNLNEIGGGEARDIYYGRASISWEIDLWGKLRHANRAATAELLGTEMNRRAITVGIIAETASLYFHLSGLNEQLSIARQTLETRKQSTKLITTRFEGGEVAELDKFQAQTQEAIAAALIPDIERQIVQTQNAMSILLGSNFRRISNIQANQTQRLPTSIPAGLPSDLIRQRPDVLAAEQQWIMQNEKAGIAQAQRFPSISLTGMLGIASQDLSTMLSGTANTWSVLGSISGPIFSFGKNKRRVEAEKFRTTQVGLDYEKAVMTALAEIDYSLFSINSYKQEYDARLLQVNAANGAVKLSRARYDDGFTNYSEVLDNERTYLDAQMTTARALEHQLQSVVELYKALGGGSDAVEK